MFCPSKVVFCKEVLQGIARAILVAPAGRSKLNSPACARRSWLSRHVFIEPNTNTPSHAPPSNIRPKKALEKHAVFGPYLGMGRYVAGGSIGLYDV